MGITIREPSEGDFFPWLGLYEQYAVARGAVLTDLIALRLWSWITDPAAAEHGLVAIDDTGRLVGAAHFHDVPRPLSGELTLLVDDLVVAADRRSDGVEQALLDTVVAQGATRGAHGFARGDHSADDEPAIGEDVESVEVPVVDGGDDRDDDHALDDSGHRAED